MSTGTPEVHRIDLRLERLAAHAQRLADLIKGASALLAGDCSPHAVTTARDVIRQAGAVMLDISLTVDELAEKEAATERARRLHVEESARAKRILDEAQRLDREEVAARRADGGGR